MRVCFVDRGFINYLMKFCTIVLVFLSVCCLSVGCGSSSLRYQRFQVALNSSVKQPEQLASIYTVLIRPPEIERDLTISQEEANRLILDSWNELANFRVVNGNESAVDSVDAYLLTKVLTYQDRVGSDIGVLKPAKVSFRQQLIRKLDNQLIWEGQFAHTDRSATDNMFLLESSGWHTARELLQSGLRVAADSVSDYKDNYFKGHLVDVAK